MKSFLSVIVASVCFFAQTAWSADVHELVLQHGTISHFELEAKVGDTIKIIHKDEESEHGLYLTDDLHQFDLSEMKHGDHYDLMIKHTGEFLIQCHEMPGMEIKISVSN